MLAKYYRTAVAAILAVVAVTLDGATSARAADEIEVFNNTGGSTKYDKSQLATALGTVNNTTGYRVALESGGEYPLTNVTVSNANNLTIESNEGYTVRITGFETGGYLHSVNNHLSEGDPLLLFGAVPDGLSEGPTYFVREPGSAGFRLSGSKTGPLINKLTEDGPNRDLKTDDDSHELLLFGQYHARIVPTSSTAAFNYLLRLSDCSGFVIKNVAFDGKYDKDSIGYENGFKNVNLPGGAGTLFEAKDCAGLLSLNGVHVANNRGIVDPSNQTDTASAMGVHLIDCGDATLTNCTGQRTGYNSWRSTRTNVSYSFCRSENPHHRCIGHKALNAEATSKLEFTNCDFIRDELREVDLGFDDCAIREDLDYSSIGNIDHQSSSLLATFVMRDCYASWKKDGNGNSWYHNGVQTTFLLKVEGIENATFENCEFLHGGNDNLGRPVGNNHVSATIKTDSNRPVNNLTIDGCVFSGAVNLHPTFIATSNMDTLKIKDSTLMQDGSFGFSEAIVGVQYPTLEIDNTVVNNITGGVVRMGAVDFVSTGSDRWEWTISGLNANASGNDDRFFAQHRSSGSFGGLSPLLSDVNFDFNFNSGGHNVNTFNTDGTFNWFFSTSDPTTNISN